MFIKILTLIATIFSSTVFALEGNWIAEIAGGIICYYSFLGNEYESTTYVYTLKGTRSCVYGKRGTFQLVDDKIFFYSTKEFKDNIWTNLKEEYSCSYKIDAAGELYITVGETTVLFKKLDPFAPRFHNNKLPPTL